MRHRWVALLSGISLAAALAPGPASAMPPQDPYFSRQWGLTRIQADRAWPLATGNGVLIAIVDSGVDLTHPDLDAQIVSYPDADFVEPDGNCSPGKKGQRTCTQDGAQDENGHGTHVAGIAAAETNNGIGVAGTAPAAKILPVRVLDEDATGSTPNIAAGIRYAADKGARVINLSLTYTSGEDQVEKALGSLKPVYDAIDYAFSKGAVLVASAGNDSVPICAEPSAHPQVLCVGATDSRDLRTFYSNGDPTIGKNFVVAPGGAGTEIICSEEIFSTYLRSEASFCSTEPGYEGLSGTSMSAPFVSGIAALLAGKGLNNSAIMTCIAATTDDLGIPGRDSVYGFGRVNAYSAVTGC